MNIQQKLKLWYPQDVLTPSTPYVYFQSLLRTETGNYIYNTVAPYFQKSLGEISISNAQGKIESALHFLQMIIKAESQKEMAFIQFLTTKIRQNKLTLQVPSSEEDWSDFIQQIQSAINLSDDLGLKAISNEFCRLKINDAIRKKADESAYFTHHLDDQVSMVGEYLKKVEALIDSRHKTDDIGKQIYNIILNQFGANLLELRNNQLVFNRRELAALVQYIAAKALKQYTIETWTGYTRFNSEAFIKTVSDDTFQQDILAYIDSAKRLPWVTEDLLKTFEMQTAPMADDSISLKERDRLLSSIRNLEATDKELDKLSNAVHDIFQNKNIVTEKSFNIISKSQDFAEVLSNLTLSSLPGAFYGKGTGISGTKPDNVIAFLTMDTSQLDQNKKEDEIIIDKIMQLRAIMKELTSTLKNTNTTGYYQKQQENWKKAEMKMQNILNDLSKIYGHIVDCYTIEDSTKNYVALNAKSRGIVNESFHGGSLGAKLEDQLAKINALSSTGGFDMLDITWLKTAIINSGPNMIANKQKNSIEQYLSTFAAILLFDDQINIADEAIQDMASITGSSINKIHLFSLNSGYYPISYVLQLTYNALEKGYNDILAEMQAGSGVKVNIVNYVTEPQQNYLGWSHTANIALNSTKLEVQFMVHFMGILNRLLPNIPQ